MSELTSQTVTDAISAHKALAGALMPILHAIQDRLGYVPPEAVPELAEALNLSQAEVHGVISFYHDFRESPPGKHVLKICRAEACQAMGASGLVAHVERSLGTKLGETSKDGEISLEAAYCLGLCASGPAAMLDGRVLARLTAARTDAIIQKLRETA